MIGEENKKHQHQLYRPGSTPQWLKMAQFPGGSVVMRQLLEC